MVKRLLALLASAALCCTAATAQQSTATQILGNQVGVLAENNAMLLERLGNIQQQLVAVTKERDAANAKIKDLEASAAQKETEHKPEAGK